MSSEPKNPPFTPADSIGVFNPADPIDDFNPEEFIGENWEIIAGDIGHQESTYYAVIRKQSDGTYTLYSKVGKDGKPVKRHELSYVPRTRTLEGTGDGVHRSISFWDGESGSVRPQNRIFAMRSAAVPEAVHSKALCPWEDPKAANGAWGGEDG